MKYILTPEDINFLEDVIVNATTAPWSVLEGDKVGTAWVVPELNGNPVALVDYRDASHNKSDAHFIACARNYMPILIAEIKRLRKRVTELIQANNIEARKSIELRYELDKIKKELSKANENN